MSAFHINRFPPEILAHILRHCDCQAFNCSRMLQMACVCRHWHDVLFSHPEFWTTMECTISTKFQNKPDPVVPTLVSNLQRWFQRAGNLPLNLTLSFKIAAGKIALLYDYLIGVAQWRSLTFIIEISGASNWRWLEGLISTAQGRGQACWPQLETLEIDAPVRYTTGRFALPLEDVAPKIQHLRVSIEELQFSLSSVFQRFPWAHITHFEFSGTTGDASLPFYLHLLSWAPNLVSLKALDWPSDLTAPVTVPPSITAPVFHHALRHVSLHHSPSGSQFLTTVRLPSLRVLELCRPTPTPLPIEIPGLSDGISKLRSTSRCEIEALHLKWTPLSEQDLVDVLTVVGPSVEYVDLDEAASSYPNVPDSFFALLQENRNPSWRETIPRLKHFSYNEGYRCGVIGIGDDGYETFRDAPLDWWRSTAAGRGEDGL